MQNYLEFEKPLAEIEGKAEELRAMARANEEMDVEKEASALDKKAQTMLGVGATSIGRTPGAYVQNIAETGAWARSVEAGVLPVGRGCKLDADDRLRGAVIEALMCQGWVDLSDVSARHGVADGWYAYLEPILAEMQRDGLLTYGDGEVRATEQGLPLIRVIAACFDAYLDMGIARHAVAV